ncbi:hypothetical protein ACEQ8H_006122 [Pleosporales sp. CAS-2024a]
MANMPQDPSTSQAVQPRVVPERQCTNHSFDDFVPQDRMSTWSHEDEKEKMEATKKKKKKTVVTMMAEKKEKVKGKSQEVKKAMMKMLGE